jgi:hypothetical protein
MFDAAFVHMAERVTDQENESAEELDVVDAPRHWAGYPGEEEARSYPVVDRGRYWLLLALFVVGCVITALAFMIHGYKREAPRRTTTILTTAIASLGDEGELTRVR